MPNTIPTSVKDLSLDLSNFRTVPQTDELQAVQTMIAISPDRFWALMEGLIDDGYLPTENILVLRMGMGQSKLIVKEGNRRIAALKLIHGYLPNNTITIPDDITTKIRGLSTEWKKANERVPCTIYESEDATKVDRIVSLAHGKGEKAGRDQWNAVARARHNRDVNESNEPALDLLEKYLKEGRNLTLQEKERWGGDYPLTVLDDAMKRISNRFGVSNAPELAKIYPSIQYRDALDNILKAIGLQIIVFKTIRNKKEDFAIKYGVPPATSSGSSEGAASQGGSTGPDEPSSEASSQSQSPQGSTSSATGSAGKMVAAVAIHDPRGVKRVLKQLRPVGNNRQKVVTLRNEALLLDLNKTPLAFCFLLRSMFEISAKVYCDDHKATGGPSFTKSDGTDKKLVDVLGDITKYMTTLPNQKQDQAMVKALHGAMVELGKTDGILSVTSMNQLIHNPRFSVTASDVSTTFGNIFPLLEAMNR